jgi:CHAT domain-containing protein
VLRRETADRPVALKGVAVLADPVFDEADPRVKAQTQPSRRVTRAILTVSDGLDRALRGFAEGGERDALPRLPFTRAEAEAILSLVPESEGLRALDFKASRATALGPELGNYRVIHFATHGLLNTGRPELSGLVLSLVDERGRLQDGFLSLREIFNLRLPAELVVLSACRTGLGQDIRGEGLVGLSRGFMHAGAKRVISSLWKVSDGATAELMKRFYRELLEKGQSPASALRAAQVGMWQEMQQQPPYFWAAFTLQGEYQ